MKRFIALATVIVVGATARGASIFSDRTFGTNGENDKTVFGIADERAWYYQQSGLCSLQRDSMRFSDRQWGAQAYLGSLGDDSILVIGNIGYRGYFAGPQRYIVDECALSDPLLSKLPCDTSNGWRVGHFQRKMPSGYLETLTSGQNQIEDRSLAEYYDRMQTVVRGELFTRARFCEILDFNFGAHDALVQDYANSVHTSVSR
jgi:arabinofuranosyltransferase